MLAIVALQKSVQLTVRRVLKGPVTRTVPGKLSFQQNNVFLEQPIMM
jgi:hypothetical protein